MRSKALTVLLFLTACLGGGICPPPPLSAQSPETQSPDSEARLREGLEHFQEGRYEQAVASFRSIISGSADAGGPALSPEAYYWIARSYMALNMHDEAERHLEYFLSSYPENRLYPEASYQKGRLLFLQGEPENAILMFDQFLAQYPDNDLVANALYWTGESLYSLGRLDEAAELFAVVVNDYPRSFKVSDAAYRLSLIDFKRRENELMKLLKWSHEETLRVTEEFQRREKAYEQAIGIYQHRLSSGGQTAQSTSTADLAALQGENERLRQRISALEAQLAGQGAEDASGAAVYEELESRRGLLQAKADALAVKEALLEALAGELETLE